MYMQYIEAHEGATPEQFFESETSRAGVSSAVPASLAWATQQLHAPYNAVDWSHTGGDHCGKNCMDAWKSHVIHLAAMDDNHKTHSGKRDTARGRRRGARQQQLGYLYHTMVPGTAYGKDALDYAGADGLRGTEHLPHSLLKKLQAAENSAGVGAERVGPDASESVWGEGARASPVSLHQLYQRVSHDADARNAIDDGVAASGVARPEAFFDMMNSHPYFEMSAPASEEQYFDSPPFSTKARRLPQLAHVAQLPEGVVSKESEAQRVAREEDDFVREAHVFFQHADANAHEAPQKQEQEQEQDVFVDQARRFLSSNVGAKKVSTAAADDATAEKEEAAFAKEANAFFSSDEDFAMPPPSNVFFDDAAITRKDWEAAQMDVATAEKAGGEGAAASAFDYDLK